MTALEMAGVSLTLLQVDEELLFLLGNFLRCWFSSHCFIGKIYCELIDQNMSVEPSVQDDIFDILGMHNADT